MRRVEVISAVSFFVFGSRWSVVGSRGALGYFLIARSFGLVSSPRETPKEMAKDVGARTCFVTAPRYGEAGKQVPTAFTAQHAY